ncbi:MAG: peptide chain release factor-like protein [Kiritimatiellia bacterium]
MTDPHVTKAKKDRLSARMRRLGISEDDLVEKFILGSGKGGQKVNKTASCVYLRHVPSGIDLKCQQERSRELNRFLARRRLCDKLGEKILGEKSARRQEQEKIRRRKRRKSRRQKERMLKEKHKRSEKKQRRRSVKPEEEA